VEDKLEIDWSWEGRASKTVRQANAHEAVNLLAGLASLTLWIFADADPSSQL
jgi:hypothetical protein